MSILISANQISKAFGVKTLFEGLTFAIHENERIGLIGPNGVGKSTLLKILNGVESIDEGELSMKRGLRTGFLEQVPHFKKNATILSTLLEHARDPSDWETIRVAGEWISKLELDSFGPEYPIADLSGGWKKRVALGRELVKGPDLLLLDEPTNHLDLESILWLEGFLARASFSVLTITHDRAFLEKTTNRILELNPRHAGGILSVDGNYSRFLEVRADLLAAQEKRETVLQNTLRRETEWLRQGAKARTTKQQARIQRAHELKSEVEDLSQRNQVQKARLNFEDAGQSPKKLIDAKGLGKSYGSKSIFQGLDLRIGPGTRLGLLGRNGSGKSTLLRVLIGDEKPSHGEVFHSDMLKVAYFDQTRETLDPTLTVLRTLCPTGETVEYRGSRVHVRSYMDRFLFTQAQMDMAVGKLSGGEQSRLLLARLMLRPANVLILDEPTNDLDFATLALLEDSLSDFDGAVILVTHDRAFMDSVATDILAFPELTRFSDIAQWEKWMRSQNKAMSSARPGSTPSASDTPKKKGKLSYNEQREFEGMEGKILKLETKLGELTRESENPELASNAIELGRVSKEMATLQSEIDTLYMRWSELENKRAGD